MTFWEWLTSRNGELALAGLVGSSVSVAMEWNGVVSGIRKLFVGTAAAYYLAPLGLPMFHWALGKIEVNAEQASGVGGFIMGVGGVIIVEIILKAFRIRSREMKATPDDKT